MCVPPFGARQRFGKHVPAATNTRNSRKIVGLVIFYTVRVLSKESVWVCLCIPSHVEPGLNTSTVALRVVGEDEKGTQCLGI
jgi:hypothetical protein